MIDGAFSHDPIAWFQHAFEEASRLEKDDASRAALATVDANGQPNVRYVLVKGVGQRGFVFFTNYQSAKAQALRANQLACFAKRPTPRADCRVAGSRSTRRSLRR